jgi:hypothetical protein
MVDFRKDPRKQLEATRREVQEILTDPYRSANPRQQHQDALQAAREGRSAHNELSRQANEALDAEMARLERLANPPPARGQRSTAELLERQELLHMNERRWERMKDGVVDEYKQAIEQGDRMKAELMEDFAGEFIENSGAREEFGQLVYEQQRQRLPAQAQAALTQLEELTQEEGAIRMGLAFQRGLMNELVDGVRQGGPTTMREDSPSYAEHEQRLAKVGGGEDG